MAHSISQPEDIRRAAWKIFFIQQANLLSALPSGVYVILLMAQISDEQTSAALLPVPVIALLFGMILPLLIVRRLTGWAMTSNPSDQPGDRLVRLLKLPRALEFGILLPYVTGNAAYVSWLSWRLDKPGYIIFWGTAINLIQVMLVMIWTRIFIERMLMPYVSEEFLKAPHVQLRNGNGPLWPRQSWYLPYSFALFVLCTVCTLGTVLLKMGQILYENVAAKLPSEILPIVKEELGNFQGKIWVPLLLISLFMLVTSALSAYLLTQQQQKGFQSVQKVIEGFAGGTPRMPSWVTTDEMGDLTRATSRMFEQLRAFSLSLGNSAHSLKRSAEELVGAANKQAEGLALQATALQETQVTAQEIKQTSLLAAQKAETILQQTQRAEQISQAGETALDRTLNGLKEIGEQVNQMAGRIKSLDTQTQRIANITNTVKDLADQSNMLALNAAIEAVRSGEHGKGFGVVAREIRALADQSIQATNGVREILQDISLAISTTVSITEKGSEKIESSLKQIGEFGGNIQQLSGIVRDSSASVRQITAAVGQQNSGISQIFQAVSDLNKVMEQTMTQVRASGEATEVVRAVAENVSNLLKSYGWQRAVNEQEAAGAHLES